MVATISAAQHDDLTAFLTSADICQEQIAIFIEHCSRITAGFGKLIVSIRNYGAEPGCSTIVADGNRQPAPCEVGSCCFNTGGEYPVGIRRINGDRGGDL